jgi:glycosyltransferase involved in cell wall biosynthesis
VVPHAVPQWKLARRNTKARTFTVGFAGRLVPEKGVMDLVDAAERLRGPVRVLFVGDGPLRADLEARQLPNGTIEVWSNFAHSRMPEAYDEMDVLVLPSRSTPGWSEQFGRVLVEALSCGVPIVGSDSGEIPWVVQTTGGGRVFREGDTEEPGAILEGLRADPAARSALADRGKATVERTFTAEACAEAMADLLAW